MSSFKLESGGSAKDQARSAGTLLIVLGVVITVLFDVFVGGAMTLIGVLLAIGSHGASS